MKSSMTPSPPMRANNSIFSLFLMITLVSVLFLFAIGFKFADNLYSLGSLFFQKIRQLFTFTPFLSPPVQNEPSLIKDILYARDLESGMAMEHSVKGDASLPVVAVNPSPDLEIEMVNSVPAPMPVRSYKSLDMAIETPPPQPVFPKPIQEEIQEPIPIDEAGIPTDNRGWCLIGQSKGARGCAPVGAMDKCVTGELYATQMQCLQTHPDDAVIPPPLL